MDGRGQSSLAPSPTTSSSALTGSFSPRDLSHSIDDPDEKFLYELKERLSDDEFKEEDKDEVLDTLLEIIAEKQEGSNACKLAVECMILLGEGMKKGSGLGQRLGAELEGDHQNEALRAITEVVSLLPRLRSSFAALFVQGLVAQLVLNITPLTVEPIVFALKRLILTAPEGVASLVRQVDLSRGGSRGEPPAGVNMRFVGDHFCTGIKLGKGMFGTVFLGYHIKTARKVAIKVFDWETLTKAGKRPERKAEKQLRREIELMKEAHHPNIVQLLDVVLTHPESTAWSRPRSWLELISLIKNHAHSIHLILEYVPGGDMRDYLRKKGRLSEKEARYWLRQLASGMKFMKDKGILHRDLKPDNLLLTSQDEKGILKVADFGLGRFLHAGEVAETGGVGTPLYMAPEILQWQPHTSKADLWSVGVLVYKMLTDDFPFPASNPRQLLDRILTETLTFPEDLQLSDEMKDLLSRLLQRDESLRISWNEFFLHPCVNLTNEVWGDTSQSALSASYSEIIRELEAREREVDTLRSSLAEAEKKYNEMLNQLKEKDALVENLRRKEAAFQEEKTRFQAMLRESEDIKKRAESLESMLREKDAALQKATAKSRERKKELHKLKKKLKMRRRESVEGEWMSSMLSKQSSEINKRKSLRAELEVPLSTSPPASPRPGGSNPEEVRLKELKLQLRKSQKEHELKEIELARGKEKAEKDKEKAEKELHMHRKKEKEERRSYLEKINKLKKERDEFAAERAALQMECERLLQVSTGMTGGVEDISPQLAGATAAMSVIAASSGIVTRTPRVLGLSPPTSRSRKTSK